MSSLNNIEKIKIETLFGMSSGWVLDFSDRSFQEFVVGSVGLDILDSKYEYASNSKANRLRAFLRVEPNFTVGKLLCDLLEYWKTKRQLVDESVSEKEQSLYEECRQISERLMKDNPVQQLDAIQPFPDDKNIALLAQAIRDLLEKDQPEAALDRMHTYVIKTIRQLCENHELDVDKKKPLHALFGEYVKYLKMNGLIESNMTERILKSSISILKAFNDVRNNQSFAHDNPILNYHESVLIVDHILSLLKFLQSIEGVEELEKQSSVEDDWEIPF
jgi:hypothetical protein